MNNGKVLKKPNLTSETITLNLQHITKEHREKPLTTINRTFKSHDNKNIGINKYITPIKNVETINLYKFISDIKSNNVLSIPQPDENLSTSIKAFVNKIKILNDTVSLPAVPDASQFSHTLQQQLDQELITALESITDLQNEQLSSYLLPEQAVTTTGIIDSRFIPEIEKKQVATRLSSNPYQDMGILTPITRDVIQWNNGYWTNAIAQLYLHELLDVNIELVESGNVLMYNGTQWINQTIITDAPFAIEDATNVNSASDPGNSTHYLGWDNVINQWINRQINYDDLSNTPTYPTKLHELTDIIALSDPNNAYHYLGWNNVAKKWVDRQIDYTEIANVPSIANTINELSDITISNLIDGHILQYNGANWVNVVLPSVISNVEDLTNVTITTPSIGDVLQFTGTEWINTNIEGTSNTLNDLIDVTITNVSTSDILSYNGTKWINTATIGGSPFLLEDALNVNSAVDPNDSTHYVGWDNINKEWINKPVDFTGLINVPTFTTNLHELLDVLTDIDPDNNTHYLGWDNINNKWINRQIDYTDISSIPSIPNILSDLTDVNFVAPVNEQILQYNGSMWVNATIPSLTQNLEALTNVTITTPTTGDILQYSSGIWVNTTVAGVSNALENLVNVNSQADPNDSTHYLGWDNNAKEWINRQIDYNEIANPPSISVTLEELTNVTISNAGDPNNDVSYLKWDDIQNKWIDKQIDFSELTGNITLTSITGWGADADPGNNDHYLGWDNTSNIWINRKISYTQLDNLPTLITKLEDLDNVTALQDPNDSTHYLGWDDGSNTWINRRVDYTHLDNIPDTIVEALDDLSDATITTPATGQVLQYNGTKWVNTTIGSTGTILSWLITDTQSPGTTGGAGTPNTWNTRSLNTININSGPDVTIANNQLIIQAGNYIIDINCPFYKTNNTRIRVRNITDLNTIIVSPNMYSSDGVHVKLDASINIESTKIFEIQYYITFSNDTTDLGVPLGIDNETYTTVRISKLASTVNTWLFVDSKVAGTVGGTATINSWQTRVINTMKLNGGTYITLASNQLTFTAGSYHLDIFSSFYATKGTKLRFRNITDNVTTAISNNMFSCENASISFDFNMDVIGTKIYELQYYSTYNGREINLGVPMGIDDEEIYTSIRIIKF